MVLTKEAITSQNSSDIITVWQKIAFCFLTVKHRTSQKSEIKAAGNLK